MDLFKEISAPNGIGTQLLIKQEPQSEFLHNLSLEPVLAVQAADGSSQGIKNEVQSEPEIIKTPSKKRRKVLKTNCPCTEEVHRKGNSSRTQLPCIVSIKSCAVLEETSQKNHNGTCDTSDEMPNTSLQSSISEKTCESYDHITLNETIGQSNANNTFTSKVYQILVEIQSTLKDLKADMQENSKKIDELQKFFPQPWAWQNIKSDFDFPVSTDKQLLELEEQLEDIVIASKLFTDLTSRTYTSWREMVLVCLKYMLSRNVAVLYNLNGCKGSKKKFLDLNMCNILVACVQHKYKEAAKPDILKRISFILAGARDWQGSRKKQN